jgi:hypothetical protein
MPSPVLIAALVVNGNTRPAPPVQTMTALAVIARTLPSWRLSAPTPITVPPSTSSVVAYHSS